MSRIFERYTEEDVEDRLRCASGAMQDERAIAILVAGTMMANALEDVAEAIQRLGNADANTPMGAIEALSKTLQESLASLPTCGGHE